MAKKIKKEIKEPGDAAINISLSKGMITVRHTNSKGPILFTKEAEYGDWDKIWKAIRN